MEPNTLLIELVSRDAVPRRNVLGVTRWTTPSQ